MNNPLDPAKLEAALDDLHRAGMPGVFAEVREGEQVWCGAAGVADVVDHGARRTSSTRDWPLPS